MRLTTHIIAFLLVAVSAVNCTPTGEAAAAGPNRAEPAAAQLDKATAEAKEAAQALQNYAWAQKAEFVARMRKDLVETQAELDRLIARVETASDEAKVDAKARLDTARADWARAMKHLDEAERATESTWDEVQAGFTKAYGELKTSFAEARQRLSDAVAP